MKNKVLWTVFVGFALILTCSIESIAQSPAISYSGKSISGESKKNTVNHRKVRPNGKTSIITNKKQKRIKTKIQILHSNCCPTFKAYSSKPRIKREKMLRKLNRSS